MITIKAAGYTMNANVFIRQENNIDEHHFIMKVISFLIKEQSAMPNSLLNDFVKKRKTQLQIDAPR